jgi:hypothetical protein
MKVLDIPISPFVHEEPTHLKFKHIEPFSVQDAARLGDELFNILHTQCPSILLRAMENNIILNSEKIQELVQKANLWDDYMLQRAAMSEG